MTTDSARKNAIRALAAAEGISYTEAMRRLADGRAASAALGFLDKITRIPNLPDPLTGNTWRIGFSSREDLSSPLDLYVTDGGLIGHQYFWRGEKFQVMGFTPTPTAASGIAIPWREVPADPSKIIGLFPVISDIEGHWATWAEQIADVEFSVEPDRAPTKGESLTATLIGGDREPGAPMIQFRCEEFVAALPDSDLRALVDDEWWASDRVAGILFRAALVRGDAAVRGASKWIEARYDADPDAWEEAEPFSVYFDEDETARWAANTTLYPSQR